MTQRRNLTGLVNNRLQRGMLTWSLMQCTMICSRERTVHYDEDAKHAPRVLTITRIMQTAGLPKRHVYMDIANMLPGWRRLLPMTLIGPGRYGAALLCRQFGTSGAAAARQRNDYGIAAVTRNHRHPDNGAGG